MTTKENTIAEDLSFEIFTRMIDSLENRLSNPSRLRNEVKYHQEQVNLSFQKDFNDVVNLLQTVVDKFYVDNYDISGFQNFTLSDFDFCLKHNMSLVKNCKKLLKFASI